MPSFGGVLGALDKARPGATELLQSSSRAAPELLQSSSRACTCHTNSPQALSHTKVGTDLLGLILWQNHISQDNRGYTPNIVFTAPSHHTPHFAPFCVRTAYGGDGHEMSSTQTEASDQIASRAEYKARTQCKYGLKCPILGFHCFGLFYKPSAACE